MRILFPGVTKFEMLIENLNLASTTHTVEKGCGILGPYYTALLLGTRTSHAPDKMTGEEEKSGMT